MKLLTREDIPENALTVSPTQIALFDRCNYKWHLTHQEKRVEFSVATAKMQLGGIFHLLLQEFYRLYLDRAVENLNANQLTALMEKVQAENGLTDYDSQLLFFNAYTIFITYVNWAARQEELIPLGAEVETFADTGLRTSPKFGSRPIFLHGILDLFAERLGALGLVDHKTHTRRPWTAEQIQFDTQMLFYPLLLWQQGINVEWTMINTIDMYIPSKNLNESLQREERFQRFIIRPTETMFERYRDELFKIIKKMWVNPTHQFTRRLDRYCSSCGYSEICGSYLRGFDTVELLATKFESTTMTAKEFDVDEILGTLPEELYPELP